MVRRGALVLMFSACTASQAGVVPTAVDGTVAPPPPDAGEVALPEPDAATALPRTVLAEGEKNPYRLALYGGFLYWSTSEAIRRVPLAGGGAPTTIASVAHTSAFVIDDGTLYFTAPIEGAIRKVPATGGMATTIATGGYGTGIAARAGWVYWSEGGAGTGVVKRVASIGGTPQMIASGLQQPAAVTVDDAHVYWTSTGQFWSTGSGGTTSGGGGVHRAPIAGGASIVVDPEGTPLRLALHGGRLYWTNEAPPKVKGAPASGGPATVLSTSILLESAVAADAGGVYFVTQGALTRLPLAGGEPTTIAADLDKVGDIVVDERFAYVSLTSKGTLLRLAKDGSANTPAGPISGCPSPPTVGDPAEIASTPRSDKNLELLALSLDPGRLTASQTAYDRIVRDVATIRAQNPSLASVTYHAYPTDGTAFWLELTSIGSQSAAAGQYHAWDCLNSFYGSKAVQLHTSASPPSAQVTLKGLYNIDLLLPAYRNLPEVKSANRIYGLKIPEAHDSTICVKDRGTAYEYVFDKERTSPCEPGYSSCYDLFFFAVDPSGNVTGAQSWQEGADSGAPPSWYAETCY